MNLAHGPGPGQSLLRLRLGGALLAGLLLAGAAAAHPVPSQAHDCTVAVRLEETAVVVQYRLEIDETTALLDLTKELSAEEVRQLDTPRACFEAFLRVQGPLLAGNFQARVDGRKLDFRCTRQRYQVLDHLRCDFEYVADWAASGGLPHRFTFRDDNYDQDAGRVRVSLAVGPGLTATDLIAAEPSLLTRPLLDLRPGDDARLRRVSATVTRKPPPEAKNAATALATPATGPDEAGPGNTSVVWWVVVVLAAAVGVALRPRSRSGRAGDR